MKNIVIEELNNGAFVGISVLEIFSFPDMEIMNQNRKENIREHVQKFEYILNELYNTAYKEKIAIELLWLTEKVKNQAVASKIHLYSTVRLIAEQPEYVEEKVKDICQQIKDSFYSMKYECELYEISDGFPILECIKNKSLYAVTKAEKYNMNYRSLYPYYYCDIVNESNCDNFNSLIHTLGQIENCALSFQIIPTQFDRREISYIHEISTEIEQISSGMMINGEFYKDGDAEQTSKVLKYYKQREYSPLFLYNILVIGSCRDCNILGNKIISLLKAGEVRILNSDFKCLDLSKENIDIESQFIYYPFNINQLLIYKYGNNEIRKNIPMAQNLFRLPYIMTLEEVLSFFRLPIYEKEMISIEKSKIEESLELFDDEIIESENIKVGKILSGIKREITIGCPEKAFTKHALIVGTPGSGKTTFSINMLLQFAEKSIPFLAIEPTKTEYRALIDVLPELQIFTPGNHEVSPYIVNPFIPPKGITVEQYVPSLVSAFQAAFEMRSPLDMFFLKAINQCYSKYGWRSYSKTGDSDVTVFGMQEFILIFKEQIEKTNYSKDVKDNIKSGGLVRLSNLLEQNRNIYDTIHTIPIEDLLCKSTVLELNAIDNAEQKALLMALLLINICIYTKKNHAGDGKLKNAILIDEAHVLLAGNNTFNGISADSESVTVRELQSMIAEIRSFGTSIIIADQSPSKVSREVLANTDVKISFRLVQSFEKKLISDSMNMSEKNVKTLSLLKPGEAFFFYSGLNSPQLLKTEDIRNVKGIRLDVSDAEIKEKNHYWRGKEKMLRPYKECSLCRHCRSGCTSILRADAQYYAERIYEQFRAKLRKKETVINCCINMKKILGSSLTRYENGGDEIIIVCTRIRLIKLLQLNEGLELTKKNIILAILQKQINEDRDSE